MSFYDLNVPYTPTADLPRTLHFLAELGYTTVALSHTITGKLPSALTCAIPSPLPHPHFPAHLTVLRRATLVLTDSHQHVRLADLAKCYDLLAVRPVDEKSLQQACASLECDIISLDLTQRLPYYFRYKMLSEAIKSGKRLEICYAQGLRGDAAARRNLIANATQLIRASRGRGLVVSSEAGSAVGLRGPWDVVNLATIWGLSQERGFEAVSKEARGVVVMARLKRTGYRGVIDVVYGGEKPEVVKKDAVAKEKVRQAQGQKRKNEEVLEGEEKQISKREPHRG
ncbi:PHP domain-like protein [Teratosphaeria nubilosa]|uniref:PHP domain-like protein n=1 Tax=Teratosphaeria nubilosa TaxID=161662 RepID=A0A6G1LHD5_9PEZI|nr:PHP domain-like protein [Teratosphaeria nubilosa]